MLVLTCTDIFSNLKLRYFILLKSFEVKFKILSGELGEIPKLCRNCKNLLDEIFGLLCKPQDDDK